MRDRVKRMLGFVLVATIEGPPRSPRQTHSALKAAIGVRRPLPVAAHQHFIPRGWPAPAMGTHVRSAGNVQGNGVTPNATRGPVRRPTPACHSCSRAP